MDYKNTHKQMDALYGHMSSIGRENFNPDKEVIVSGGNKDGLYKAGDLWKHFVFGKPVEPFNCRQYGDTKLTGYPRLKGYEDPIWVDGRIRYNKTSFT